jgi:hypothetical protein
MLIKGRLGRGPSTQTTADVGSTALGYDQPVDAVSVFGRLLQTLPGTLPEGLHDTSLTETIENAAQVATRQTINQVERAGPTASGPGLAPREPGTLPLPEPEGSHNPPRSTAPNGSAQGDVPDERVEAAVQAEPAPAPTDAPSSQRLRSQSRTSRRRWSKASAAACAQRLRTPSRKPSPATRQ